MIEFPKHNFPPMAPNKPFEMVRLTELAYALMSKRLGGTDWPVPPRIKVKLPWGPEKHVAGRKPSDPVIVRAGIWTTSEIMKDKGSQLGSPTGSTTRMAPERRAARR